MFYLFLNDREYMSFKVWEFFARESWEYPVSYAIAFVTTDTYLDAGEFVGSEPCDDRLETILPSCASLLSYTHLRELHIEIIDKYEKICFCIDLMIIHHLGYWLSWEIHVCCWFEEDDFFSVVCPLTHETTIPRVRPMREPKSLYQSIHHQKSHIVSCVVILRSRIAESDDEFHRVYIPSIWGISKKENKNPSWPRDFLKATTNVVKT